MRAAAFPRAHTAATIKKRDTKSTLQKETREHDQQVAEMRGFFTVIIEDRLPFGATTCTNRDIK